MDSSSKQTDSSFYLNKWIIWKKKKWLQEPSLAKCNNNNINAVVLYCKEQVLSLQSPIKEFWKKS